LESTIFKKAVMAATGFVLFGFVTAHLLGNLQIFLGQDRLNEYSAMLKSNAEILWGARSFLLLCIVAHIVTTIQLVRINQQARPVAYAKKNNSHSTLDSRTMYYSGPMVAAFIVYHLLHFTTGTVHPDFSERDVYSNVVIGFQHLPVSIAYIVAVGLLCLHLSHGVSSMFQSLGFSHPQHTPRIKQVARAVGILYFLGFASIPVAVLAGILKAPIVRL
jgi:succinate dehydrogenase / fumarate reductase cytochrome b subunit